MPRKIHNYYESAYCALTRKVVERVTLNSWAKLIKVVYTFEFYLLLEHDLKTKVSEIAELAE